MATMPLPASSASPNELCEWLSEVELLNVGQYNSDVAISVEMLTVVSHRPNYDGRCYHKHLSMALKSARRRSQMGMMFLSSCGRSRGEDDLKDLVTTRVAVADHIAHSNTHCWLQ